MSSVRGWNGRVQSVAQCMRSQIQLDWRGFIENIHSLRSQKHSQKNQVPIDLPYASTLSAGRERVWFQDQYRQFLSLSLCTAGFMWFRAGIEALRFQIEQQSVTQRVSVMFPSAQSAQRCRRGVAGYGLHRGAGSIPCAFDGGDPGLWHFEP